MLHVSLTQYGVVRGTNRDLVAAAALILSEPLGPAELLAAVPGQANDDLAA